MALAVLCSLGALVPATTEARAIRAEPVAPADKAPPVVTYASASVSAPRTVGVPVPGTSLLLGRSTILIAAPMDKVRQTVLDFAHYPEFMPHYTKCKVLGRTATGARDVYMEVTAVHGLVKMWARVEVNKPLMIDGVEVHETKFVDGNVKDLKATWRLKKIDEATTEVTLEIFLLPRLPLPNKLLNQENLGGSADAVIAVQKRVSQM